jgi:hypothetical protein
MVLRFERGRVRRLGVPSRASCVDGARPSEARQQGPSFFAFDHKLEYAEEFGLSVSQRRVGETVRRRWLQRAVDAFEGRAEPVLLKYDYPTRHGDLIETFLDIRRGSADLTNWKEYGFQHLSGSDVRSVRWCASNLLTACCWFRSGLAGRPNAHACCCVWTKRNQRDSVSFRIRIDATRRA